MNFNNVTFRKGKQVCKKVIPWHFQKRCSASINQSTFNQTLVSDVYKTKIKSLMRNNKFLAVALQSSRLEVAAKERVINITGKHLEVINLSRQKFMELSEKSQSMMSCITEALGILNDHVRVPPQKERNTNFPLDFTKSKKKVIPMESIGEAIESSCEKLANISIQKKPMKNRGKSSGSYNSPSSSLRIRKSCPGRNSKHSSLSSSAPKALPEMSLINTTATEKRIRPNFTATEKRILHSLGKTADPSSGSNFETSKSKNICSKRASNPDNSLQKLLNEVCDAIDNEELPPTTTAPVKEGKTKLKRSMPVGQKTTANGWETKSVTIKSPILEVPSSSPNPEENGSTVIYSPDSATENPASVNIAPSTSLAVDSHNEGHQRDSSTKTDSSSSQEPSGSVESCSTSSDFDVDAGLAAVRTENMEGPSMDHSGKNETSPHKSDSDHPVPPSNALSEVAVSSGNLTKKLDRKAKHKVHFFFENEDIEVMDPRSTGSKKASKTRPKSCDLTSCYPEPVSKFSKNTYIVEAEVHSPPGVRSALKCKTADSSSPMQPTVVLRDVLKPNKPTKSLPSMLDSPKERSNHAMNVNALNKSDRMDSLQNGLDFCDKENEDWSDSLDAGNVKKRRRTLVPTYREPSLNRKMRRMR